MNILVASIKIDVIHRISHVSETSEVREVQNRREGGRERMGREIRGGSVWVREEDRVEGMGGE